MTFGWELARCRLEKQFVLCGTTKEIPEKLKAATIFAFPSIHEGFGLALTEAMAMGLPVVACNDCTACRSLIRNGENGLLSEPSPQAFAEALKMLIRDRELRMRLGAATREDMKQFAADKIWDRWDRLIQQLIRNQIII